MKVGSKRTRPNRAARSVVGNTRDLEVLRSLAWARFLTTSQVARLHFPSKRTSQRRLRALLDHGLIRAHLQGAALHLETVFTLTPRGAAALEVIGVSNVRPSRIPRLLKLAHGLAVRDVFVAFVLAERMSGFLLEDLRFEEDLASEPIFRTAGIIPDCLAVIERNTHRRLVGCEVDLGTETTTTLRTKLIAWKRLLDSQVLGAAELVIVSGIESRVTTFEQLLASAGCAATVLTPRTMLATPSALAELFAPAVRTVRTANGRPSADFEPLDSAKAPAFRGKALVFE